MNYSHLLSAPNLTILFVLFLSSCKPHRPKIEQHYYKAAEYSESHNHKRALLHAHKITQIEPSPRSLAFKATLLYQNNKLQESKKTFELALEQRNISPEIKSAILNNYATLLVALGNENKAQAIWKKLAQSKEYATPEVAWFNLGMIVYKKSKTHNKERSLRYSNEALSHFSQATALEPEYVDAYFFKAKVLLKLKRKNEARQALKTVLALAPEHTAARKLLDVKA